MKRKTKPEAGKPLTWTARDSARALKEGWELFDLDDPRRAAIQRDDAECKFESDDAAVLFVVRKEKDGSKFHAKALTVLGLARGSHCKSPGAGRREWRFDGVDIMCGEVEIAHLNMYHVEAKKNAALIVRAVNAHSGLVKIVGDQEAVQRKIFALLNALADGQHMKMRQRVDHESTIAQVYGDLAAHFGELTAQVAALRAAGEEV